MKSKVEKEPILKGYDDVVEGKRNSRLAMWLVTGGSIIVTISALVISASLMSSSADKMKVIDNTGRVIKSDLQREEEVRISTVQAHLSNALFYLNSFDRNSIKENQARALFLVDKKSADRIFNSYNRTGAYNDALQSGYIYRAKFIKITKLEGNSEPFAFTLEGELEVTDGSRTIKTKIIGTGNIRYSTPNFPNNPQGMLVYDYLQQYEDMPPEEAGAEPLEPKGDAMQRIDTIK